MIRTFSLQRLDGLNETDQGLSQGEAEARLARYGPNSIIESVQTGWWPLFRDTLKDPMLWFLLATSLLFGLVGERTEALILLLALIPFLGMDAFLHRRTQASIAGLSSQLCSEANVLRGGIRQQIDATGLVPGDLAIVVAGEFFPADGLLLGADTIQVDESALTGEAYPVRKSALDESISLQGEGRIDSVHWGLAGTRVLTGEAHVRIVYTGADTRYGEIVRSALRGSHERTPLQRAVASLVSVLLGVAGMICILLAGVRLQQGHGLVDALLSALTLAVAALPEEFPVVLTFFLGVGVYRLAQRQAMVRRGVVVENIGRVSCICTDKTGTLTEGRLHLAHCYPAQDLAEDRLLQIAAIASRGESGDPMDQAILKRIGTPPAFPVLACHPFTEDRKRETAIVRENGDLLAAVKGAPEVVLSLCTEDEFDAVHWHTLIAQLAETGHKVIACAWREMGGDQWPGGEPDRGFRLAGLLAFEDPVRKEVPEALQTCRVARIRVVMVTGDHPATAMAVAREIGLGGDTPVVISGDEMAQRIQSEGGRFLREVDVIARAIPGQKLTLVQTLQGEGEIVAVTGDGVNDVPALQAADIGIAMGGRGTRSARDVAAIVLLDDNFRSIVRAIAEGRQLFSNLQLSFEYLLMIHLPLVVTAAFIPLAGYPLLYLPIHIVWLELIIHPTALLVFQSLPASPHLSPMPSNHQPRFFSPWQWFVISLTGIVVTALIVGSYVRSLGIGYDVDHARAMALVTLIVASAGITATLSRMRGRIPWVIVLATIGLSALLVQTPVLASLLHLHPLHGDDWAIAVAGGLIAAWLPMLSHTRSARSSAEPGT